MLPCSACIFAATAAAAATAATWFVDAPLLAQLRSSAPELLHVSELVVLVTLLVRRFFLRFRSVNDETGPAVAVTTAAMTALDQGAWAAEGTPDENVGDGLFAVFRTTINEHELPDSGPSSSANVG